MLKKIVIIGPESTGKSTLCEQLAKHYHTIWCPEFAREYLLKNGMNYTYDDLLKIAKGQLALEDAAVKTVASGQLTVDSHSPATAVAKGGVVSNNQDKLLFIDTDMYVMKVWCEFVFEKCHLWIIDQIVERQYALYLLCNVDLPWSKDELREYPDLETRKKLYHIYKDIMINQPVPWVDIRGDCEERLERAVRAIDEMFL